LQRNKNEKYMKKNYNKPETMLSKAKIRTTLLAGSNSENIPMGDKPTTSYPANKREMNFEL